MARTNKFASLNFNDIYEKKITNNTSSSSRPLTTPNKTILSDSRIHGNMLVLSRTTPKPIPRPSPPPPPQHHPPPPDKTPPEPDSISLRPLGRTGSAPFMPSVPIQIRDKELSVSPKPGRFVPPHLRPGFSGREEKPAPEFLKQPGPRTTNQGHFGSPNRYGEDERPRSGGGYERIRRGGESDPVGMIRPGSSGTRPSSSGI